MLFNHDGYHSVSLFLINIQSTGKIMKLSARNVLKGTVKTVTHGAVDSEVVLELAPGVEIVSIITKSSAEGLGLKVGDSAFAVIKAPTVIIGVE
jgi:molybdate transport system regulatory protein